MKKKVGIVGTHGLPANYSGWETLVKNLSKYSQNVDYLIATPRSRKKEQSNDEIKSSVYVPLNASGWQSVFYDFFSILKILPRVDCILILGVSGCVFLPFIRLISKKKLIINTDGIEYRREKWGFFASKFLKISEKFAITFSNKIVADNKGICEYINNNYGKTVDAVIPYGGVQNGSVKYDYSHKYNFKANCFDLALARIVPENNVELILKTYNKIDLDIVFIGNWKSSNYGKRLFKHNWNNNIHLFESDFNEDRINSLRSSCRLYIHGHSAGGTNPSLVEAISLGCTIAAFDIKFNKYVLSNFGYYWKDSTDLIKILQKFKKIDKNLIKDHYNKNYDWKVIARNYEKIF